MRIRAVGRSAIFALAGALLLFAAPAFAACLGENCSAGTKAETAKSDTAGKPVNLRSFARKHVRVAHKPRRHHDHQIARKPKDIDRAVAATDSETTDSERLPVVVADARAQVISTETNAVTAQVAPALKQGAEPTSDSQATVETVVQVVDADELNDMDKAAAEMPSLPKLPASIANSYAEMRDDRSSTWAQTSTIGKAFIAFGVMLTLASAARMFMA